MVAVFQRSHPVTQLPLFALPLQKFLGLLAELVLKQGVDGPYRKQHQQNGDGVGEDYGQVRRNPGKEHEQSYVANHQHRTQGREQIAAYNLLLVQGRFDRIIYKESHSYSYLIATNIPISAK